MTLPARIAAIAVLALAGCAVLDTPEKAASRAAEDILWALRQTGEIAGVPVEIAVSSGRDHALVAPVAPGARLTSDQIAAGLAAITGCSARPGLMVRTATRGRADVPVPFARTPGARTGLRWELGC